MCTRLSLSPPTESLGTRLVRFQPDHFFPHSWLAWRCQSAPLLGGRPRNAPKHIGTMLKLARWLQTVLFRDSSNNFPFISQASPAKGLVLAASRRTGSKAVYDAAMGRCETVVWPLRSIVLAENWSQKQSHSP